MANSIDIKSDKQYKQLKKEFLKALSEKKDSFTFEESVLLVDYAKYLLQYMEDIRNNMGLSIYSNKGIKVRKFDDNYKAKEEIWHLKNTQI